MEAISIPVAGSIASALVAAIIALFGVVKWMFKNERSSRDTSEKKCTERVVKLEAKVDDLHSEYRKEKAAELKRAELREAEARAEKQRVVDVLQSNSRCIVEVCNVMNRNNFAVKTLTNIISKKTPSEMLTQQNEEPKQIKELRQANW